MAGEDKAGCCCSIPPPACSCTRPPSCSCCTCSSVPPVCRCPMTPICPLAPPRCPVSEFIGKKKCALGKIGCTCDPNPPCALSDVVPKKKKKKRSVEKVDKATMMPDVTDQPIIKDENYELKPRKEISKQELDISKKEYNSDRSPPPYKKRVREILKDGKKFEENKKDKSGCPFVKVNYMCGNMCLCDEVPKFNSGPRCPFAPCPCCSCCGAPICPPPPCPPPSCCPPPPCPPPPCCPPPACPLTKG